VFEKPRVRIFKNSVRKHPSARRESLCRFAAPHANRSVDSPRPTPDARRESLCRSASPEMIRCQNDQCDDAHLLYAKLKSFTARHVCRVRSPPRYQNDQCNEAHLEDHSIEQDGHFRTRKLRTSRQKATKLRRSGPPDFNRLADSGRPTRIALSIRVARRESLCRFASPDANRSVDSRRPTPDVNRSVDPRRPK
jgi:hypothetical protein